jgi:hypothetical protein
MGFDQFKTGFEPRAPWGYDDYGRGAETPWERTSGLIAIEGKINNTSKEDEKGMQDIVDLTIAYFHIKTKGANIAYNFGCKENGLFFSKDEEIYEAKAGDIFIGPSAFKSVGQLGSTIGHELVHYNQWTNFGRMPFPDSLYNSTEAEAYFWERDKIAYFGLTTDNAHIESINSKIKGNYSPHIRIRNIDSDKIK